MKRSPVALATAVLATAAVALAACGADPESTPTTDNKGIVRYALALGGSGVSGRLDPAKSTSVCDFTIMQPIYGTLVARDPATGEAKPGLAESWKAVDPRTIEFTLRSGVKFHDGKPYDAAAVKAGLERNAKQAGAQPATTLGPLIDTIEAVDAKTVRIKLKQDAAGALPLILSGREGMVASPGTEATADTQPVGAGPFKFSEQVAGQRISITRNPDYWDAASVKIGGVQWINVEPGPPTINALLGGEVDLALVTPDQIEGLKRDPSIKVTQQPAGSYYKINWNLSKAPFNNVQVRQALNHAINREQILASVFGGQGEVAWGPYPSTFFGYNAELAKKYPYDPEKAKSLLQSAGFGSGLKLTSILPANSVSFARFGEILQQQFKAVGVDLQFVQSTDIVQDYFTNKKNDLTVITWPPRPDPTDTLRIQFTPGNFNNVGNYNDAELTGLVNQLRATTDNSEKARLFKEAYRVVVEDALDLPAVFPPLMHAASSKVAGTVKQYESCQGLDYTALQ